MSAATVASTSEIEVIVAASERAARVWARSSRGSRARALRLVATRLEDAVDDLVPIAMRETHLSESRLRGELARTTFQLRLFADTLDEGDYLGVRIDHADSQWPMGPRPDLRRIRVPYGPVVVFAASNFPFAFSVAGGDTASALAAGCSVILKAHPGHLDLSAATADVVRAALREAGCPEGLFALIEGDEAGRVALTHPLVRAGAFTGSIAAGRALFDLAASRPDPIPFYGELGSINPVFVTRGADAERGAMVATELVASFTLGAGQFCTKPGVVFLPAGSKVAATLREVELPPAAPMLNQRVTDGYLHATRLLHDHPAVQVLAEGTDPFGDPPTPAILCTQVAHVLADKQSLLTECFGPTVLLVEYDDVAQLSGAAAVLDGQLTATIVAEEGDAGLPDLVEVLTTKAGRLLWNQWPTGVSVTDAQQHGGPYPATTAAGTTSVGTAAIDRFTRPVAFQGFPAWLLPAEARDNAELPQRVDGQLIVRARDSTAPGEAQA